MISQHMKRLAPYVACLAGALLLAVALPHFKAAQPIGTSITRAQAATIADREARKFGIDVDRAWRLTIWVPSFVLDKELRDQPDLLKRAAMDPVVGPRLGGFRSIYFRLGLEKFPEYGDVVVGRNGEVLSIRKEEREETRGARPTVDELRPRADAFVRSHAFAAAPDPRFESARPTVLPSRTDTVFRYRVDSPILRDRVAYYLAVNFKGNSLAGWELVDEYSDGRPFRYEIGNAIAGLFVRMAVTYALLLILLVIFLRKYHAGEVGVGTSTFLFAAMIVLSLIALWMTAAEESFGMQMGGLDARITAFIQAGFRLLFLDIPTAVLMFLAWSVGESVARERWGEKLASFDAVLRRHAFNATVGRSFLHGLLTAPAVAAAALFPALIPLALGTGYAAPGFGTALILSSRGGAATPLVSCASEALLASTVALLFIVAAFHRRRLTVVGIVAAAAVGTVLGILQPPIAPGMQQLMFGFGATLAAALIFLFYDLLTAATALYAGGLLLAFLPFITVARGDAAFLATFALAAPLALLLAYAVSALLTRREVVYTYEDLAPHVRRIVERERVKAEIDAANRIQAALLPAGDPQLQGISVASHYRAASEIGGDYFDFLKLDSGEVGIAFGDVAGHGLTSGIVMAMAKSALLVQLGYDTSPAAVLEVLNNTVIKTAPKRMLMTFFFGLLDPATRRLRFCSAGHLDPYVYRASTGRLEPLSSWGYPLGVKRREHFAELSVRFDPADRLVLYSDGLIEAIDDDGEPFGFERFEKLLHANGRASVHEIRKEILSAVKKFTRNRPPEDDQTLVVLSFDGTASRGLELAAVAREGAA